MIRQSLNTFTKKERLSGRTAISRLFSEGSSGFVYPFRYLWSAEADEDGGVSVLISVSKRYVKKANKRNLLKRRLREAYRTQKHALAEKAAAKNIRVNLAFVYSSKDIAEFKIIENAVGRILAEISERV